MSALLRRTINVFNTHKQNTQDWTATRRGVALTFICFKEVNPNPKTLTTKKKLQCRTLEILLCLFRVGCLSSDLHTGKTVK